MWCSGCARASGRPVWTTGSWGGQRICPWSVSASTPAAPIRSECSSPAGSCPCWGISAMAARTPAVRRRSGPGIWPSHIPSPTGRWTLPVHRRRPTPGISSARQHREKDPIRLPRHHLPQPHGGVLHATAGICPSAWRNTIFGTRAGSVAGVRRRRCTGCRTSPITQTTSTIPGTPGTSSLPGGISWRAARLC